MPSIDHGTITFYITTRRDNMSTGSYSELPTLPADLPGQWRRKARNNLDARMGEVNGATSIPWPNGHAVLVLSTSRGTGGAVSVTPHGIVPLHGEVQATDIDGHLCVYDHNGKVCVKNRTGDKGPVHVIGYWLAQERP